MQKKRRLAMVVLAFAAVVLGFMVSCGGGGGGGESGGSGNSGIGNTMTVIVSSATPTGGGAGNTQYTEGAINGNGYYDPDMEADIYPDSGRVIIMLSSGVTGGVTPTTVLNIVTSGHTAGAYPITGNGGAGVTTYISYTDNGQHHTSIISSGTVTIDSIGNVGDPVIGSFSAVVLCTSPSHTHGISGTFNVKMAH
jgi:hypothetical protein